MKKRTFKQVALTEKDIRAIAKKYGLTYPHVKAIIEIESTGHGFWDLEQYADLVPVINFEAQWFRRLTKGKYNSSHPDISFSWMDRLFGAGEWPRFTKASNLDRTAAIMATSWGLMQVMGFNYSVCGFNNAEDFVKAMCQSEKAQLLAGMELIKNKGLIPALKNEDWTTFAYRYNGEHFRVNDYDNKLRAAFLKHKRREK